MSAEDIPKESKDPTKDLTKEIKKIQISKTDVGKERMILIDATIAGYPDVAIKTEHTTVMEVFQDFSDKPTILLQASYQRVKTQILNRNVSEIYQSPDDWDNFCNDILLYYCLRKHLENEPMPILPSYVAPMIGIQECTLCSSPTTLKCSKCGARYCSIECQRADWHLHKVECVPYVHQKQYSPEMRF
jgi:hypothetical protein